jgi:tRNA nucleotidyltransferase (CCA-adding enzyme)
MTAKFYMVGGCVRDEILGVKPKDVDFSVECASFDAMRVAILNMGGEIFIEKPDFLTIRARIGKDTFDYVMCRKDGAYSDGRRPDEVIPGTLFDDLARRDFTMNAIAKDANGEYIDPFGGIGDIKDGLIRCVGKTADRFSEDFLRVVRAARFSITKGFRVSPQIEFAFDNEFFCNGLNNVSVERIKDEVEKMFHFDTVKTMEFFGNHPKLMRVVFSRGLWVKPTLEKA